MDVSFSTSARLEHAPMGAAPAGGGRHADFNGTVVRAVATLRVYRAISQGGTRSRMPTVFASDERPSGR